MSADVPRRPPRTTGGGGAPRLGVVVDGGIVPLGRWGAGAGLPPGFAPPGR
ncbi:hypothetical protein [Baekduia soli]|uniref:hypothetical protein n=1 Tax=Baekduia soli TaxID=496014 RepID=UPI0016528F42|nr:hypothetical protein [Baekduia soli]